MATLLARVLRGAEKRCFRGISPPSGGGWTPPAASCAPSIRAPGQRSAMEDIPTQNRTSCAFAAHVERSMAQLFEHALGAVDLAHGLADGRGLDRDGPVEQGIEEEVAAQRMDVAVEDEPDDLALFV